MQGMIFLSNYIDGILVDVRKSDAHTLNSEVTTNTLEDGSRASDHIIQQPRILSIVFEQTNSVDGLIRAKNVWGQLRNAWQKRQLVSMATEHEFYQNMAFQNVSALHTAPFKGALQCGITLVQVNSVQLQYVAVPESQLKADGTNKTASSTVNAGTQNSKQVTEPEQSALYKLIYGNGN